MREKRVYCIICGKPYTAYNTGYNVFLFVPLCDEHAEKITA